MPYIDHFGTKSEDYKQYRPDYPIEIYKYLASISNKHDLAWDCGTGNGQAAVALSKYYSNVVGSDINKAQLDVASKKENIEYYCWPAEQTALQDNSVDLIVVAQAMHWFNLEAFYREVHRVSTYQGVIASWCYSIGTINAEIDDLVRVLYAEILGQIYWPKERLHVDNEYKTIDFPFERMEAPQFNIEKEMNFTQFMGYLSTWSAVKEYQRFNQENPINIIYPDLKIAWGDPLTSHIIRWPIHMLVGHVS